MISGKENENREILFELMRDNPDLPVIIVVCYGYSNYSDGFYLYHKISFPFVDDVLLIDDYAVLKSAEYQYGFELKVLKRFFRNSCKLEEYTKGVIQEAYDNLPWQKVIVVPIEEQE